MSRVVASDGRRIPRESLERLERLDDAVFGALRGDAGALEEASEAWREALRTVDERLLDETREHYVRRARSRFRTSQQQADERLTVGFAALEIMGLFGE